MNSEIYKETKRMKWGGEKPGSKIQLYNKWTFEKNIVDSTNTCCCKYKYKQKCNFENWFPMNVLKN